MFAAVTDHVFVDGGHTIDFTNKAFEALGCVGDDAAPTCCRRSCSQTARSSRSEESGEWRHPHDLAALVARANAQLDRALDAGRAHRWRVHRRRPVWRGSSSPTTPTRSSTRCSTRYAPAPTDEQLGRALAYAAALRITRFHMQNDHGDWDTVHHSFTAANALHQALQRVTVRPSCCAARCTARCASTSTASSTCPRRACPSAEHGDLAELARCWEVQGEVDKRGQHRLRVPARRRRPPQLIAALGHALLAEDAEFHWYQMFEAARPPVGDLARRLGGGGAHPRRRRPLPRRAHADPARAPDRGPHRHPPPPRRAPLRRGVSAAVFPHNVSTQRETSQRSLTVSSFAIVRIDATRRGETVETTETRSPIPPAPGSNVDPLSPLPGSVLGAATIVAAQGALAAIGVFCALLAPHATRVRYLGHGIGAWRFPAACMFSAFAVAALVAAVGLADRRGWARPVTFAVEAAVICGYLLTFVFDPFRALLGMTLAVGVLALVLGPRADAAFAPVEAD